MLLGCIWICRHLMEKDEQHRVKTVLNAKKRSEMVGAFLDTVQAYTGLTFMFCEHEDAALQSWVESAWFPPTFSVAVPTYFLVRGMGDISSNTFSKISERDRAKDLFFIACARLRHGRTRLQEGFGRAGTYPMRDSLGVAGSLTLPRLMEAQSTNTVGQRFLGSALEHIAQRYNTLVRYYCKEWVPDIGFVNNNSTISLSDAYYASTFASKYMWEVVGIYPPTHHMKRVVPLSALFILLDDEMFLMLSVWLFAMLDTNVSMHTYELQQYLVGLSFTTRTHAFALIAGQIESACSGSICGRGARQLQVSRATISGYVNSLMTARAPQQFNKAAARVLEEYAQAAKGREPTTGRGKETPMASGSETPAAAMVSLQLAQHVAEAENATALVLPTGPVDLPPRGRGPGLRRGGRLRRGGGRGRARGPV